MRNAILLPVRCVLLIVLLSLLEVKERFKGRNQSKQDILTRKLDSEIVKESNTAFPGDEPPYYVPRPSFISDESGKCGTLHLQSM